MDVTSAQYVRVEACSNVELDLWPEVELELDPFPCPCPSSLLSLGPNLCPEESLVPFDSCPEYEYAELELSFELELDAEYFEPESSPELE